MEIVGVIDPALEPAYVRGSDDPTVPAIYLPSRLEPEMALTLYVRARGDVPSMAPAIREAATGIDPRVPVGEITTLAAMQHERFTEERLVAQGLALLGVMGLTLACGGLYGTVAFMVAMRRREIGVRMALGAEPRRILQLTLKQGMTTALVGSGAGGAVAIGISVLARANMYGVPPIDLERLRARPRSCSRPCSSPASSPRAAPRASIRWSCCEKSRTAAYFFGCRKQGV